MSDGKKNRFLVQTGYTYLHLFSGRRYIINYTLDRLEQMVDTEQFFRVSRNCIANIRSIHRISKYFAGRLLLQFQPECPHEVIVSRSRTNDFLRWADDMRQESPTSV